MPIYEYEVEGGECNICGGRFELRRPIDRPPLTECPVCQKPVHKLISAANTPKVSKAPSISDAKKAGFTVLERRDKGTYEKL
jgi:putative FmdB family regulatory protein